MRIVAACLDLNLVQLQEDYHHLHHNLRLPFSPPQSLQILHQYYSHYLCHPFSSPLLSIPCYPYRYPVSVMMVLFLIPLQR